MAATADALNATSPRCSRCLAMLRRLSSQNWRRFRQALTLCQRGWFQAPRAGVLLTRFESDHAGAGAERVGRTGHRLDCKASSTPVRRQRVSREDLDVAEVVVHPHRELRAIIAKHDSRHAISVSLELGEARVDGRW